MTQVRNRTIRAKRLIEEWEHPCAIESEKNTFDWGRYRLSRYRIRQFAQNRSTGSRSRAISHSSPRHASKCLPSRASNSLEEDFNLLATQWERETSLLSSPRSKAEHPAYQAIIQIGDKAIPLILNRMQERGGHWFWALSKLTGVSPIPQESHGRISEMRDAWLAWGRERGYC